MVGNVAGKDRTLSHGSIYPGVLQLYKEVSGQFIILSANPSSSAASKNAKIQHSQVNEFLNGTKFILSSQNNTNKIFLTKTNKILGKKKFS